MIATLNAPPRPVVHRARAPCLGLALVAVAALWAALGGVAALLSSQLLERGIH